jgi:hypothetical protein
MTLGLLFWLLMVLTLLFGVALAWPRAPEQRYVFGGSLLWWVLLALLGWQVFGPVLRG